MQVVVQVLHRSAFKRVGHAGQGRRNVCKEPCWCCIPGFPLPHCTSFGAPKECLCVPHSQDVVGKACPENLAACSLLNRPLHAVPAVTCRQVGRAMEV